MSEGRCTTVADLLSSVESGSRPPRGADKGASESGVASLGGENLTQDGRLRLSAVRTVPGDFFRRMKGGRLQSGDVLINKDGAQTGKVAIYSGEFLDAAVNEHLFILRGTGDINQRYLCHWLRGTNAQRQIARYVSGSAQPGLGRRFLREVRLSLPPLRQQHRIAEVLDAADEAIHATERLIAKFASQAQSLVQAALTATIETAPASELAALTGAPICYGIVQPGGHQAAGVQVVAIRDLGGSFTSLNRTSALIDAAYARSRVEVGDVLLSIKGTIGRVDVVPSGFSGNISRDVARLRPGPELRSEYLKIYMASSFGQAALRRIAVGSTRGEISIAPLRHLEVPVPPDLHQRRTADLNATSTDRVKAEQRALRALQQLRAGLADDLLTGRVRTVPV